MFRGKGVIQGTSYLMSHMPESGRNVLALKFEMMHQYSVCKKLALLVKQSKEV